MTHMQDTRHLLVTTILKEHDGLTALSTYVSNWYDYKNPLHYGLMLEARGKWFRPHEPLSFAVFKRWAKANFIMLPDIPRLNLAAEKQALLSAFLRDWDQEKSTLQQHAIEWQQLDDPVRKELISAAMGRRFRDAPIPLVTFQKWMRQLKMYLPASRRTKNPSRSTLHRWKNAGKRTKNSTLPAEVGL
jgi:hypothetical protein